MKLIISQQVKIKGDPFPHNWRKEIDSIIIPNIGMSIEDSLWKDPGEYKVIDVLINYQEDYSYISLEKYDAEIPDEKKDEWAHIAKLHGWACSWKQYQL